MHRTLVGGAEDPLNWKNSTNNHSILVLASQLPFWCERVLIAFNHKIHADFN
ncbi:hypothetical protein [Maribacter sp. ACAM166]|uniref:hypothetical protein n=1 Tax=Maribacter sp. ACAM166 TaxID=2508996 RepID=UPI001484DC3A|nr:hypothetical protein [Maribacter sp. ACAM166]